jgi:hypothetical protein
MTADISGGDWLIASATLALALATVAVAYVAYRQLSSLRAESRRQRTIDLYARYESRSFIKPRLAVSKVVELARAEDISLTTASNRLERGEQLQFARFCNLLEEASQQYFSDLLDPGLAEQGLAYITWAWWGLLEEYVRDQRVAQGTRRVFENWEDLHHELDPIYSLVPEDEADRIATAWIMALGGNRVRLRRRLGRLVSKADRFRLGPQFKPMRRREALRELRSQRQVLRAFAKQNPSRMALVLDNESGRTEYVLCAAKSDPAHADDWCHAAILELRATRNWSRWQLPRRRREIRYAVSGFGWYASAEDGLARIGRAPRSSQQVGGRDCWLAEWLKGLTRRIRTRTSLPAPRRHS